MTRCYDRKSISKLVARGKSHLTLPKVVRLKNILLFLFIVVFYITFFLFWRDNGGEREEFDKNLNFISMKIISFKTLVC